MVDEINDDLEQTGDEVGDLMSESEDALGGGGSGDVISQDDNPLGGVAESSSAIAADVISQEELEGIGRSEDDDSDINVDLIMDLPLQVVVELGRTKMLINDLLQIGQGSVIELNKQVGEALDVLVNGKLVARGEVVVVKDKFGVRITEVLSTIERIKQLN